MFKSLFGLVALFIPFTSVFASYAPASFTTSASNAKSLRNVQPAVYSFYKAPYIDGATRIIDLILETVGLQASFEVKRANIPNAAAIVYKGKRYILYNPSFIAAMNKAAGTPWASIAVLAHEIGHHLNGHTLDGKGSLPDVELEADEFSGFALRKMGASLSEAQVAMRIIAGAKATKTHPARADRLMAIAAGWNHADDQLAGKNVDPQNRTPAPPKREPVLEDKYIAFDVHLSFDPETRYHITVANNLVKIVDNKLELAGKLMATGKEAYPIALQIPSDDLLLISSQGKIINRRGKTLGYISERN